MLSTQSFKIICTNLKHTLVYCLVDVGGYGQWECCHPKKNVLSSKNIEAYQSKFVISFKFKLYYLLLRSNLTESF